MAESHESSVQPIKDISDEILLHIFRLLKLDDILKISCVSRRFNRLAHDQSLHKYSPLYLLYKKNEETNTATNM